MDFSGLGCSVRHRWSGSAFHRCWVSLDQRVSALGKFGGVLGYTKLNRFLRAGLHRGLICHCAL